MAVISEARTNVTMGMRARPELMAEKKRNGVEKKKEQRQRKKLKTNKRERQKVKVKEE